MKNFECPLPQLDFDVVTLGHGSGGILTNRLLKECIFQILNNDFLKDEDDGAILDLTGQMAMTTDSFVVSPVFFPGGNIGDLAIHGTVNDVAMCGAIPRYISLGLILEEGLRIEELWEVLTALRRAADNCGVTIVTGDTKVVDRGKGDKIFINTTGIGPVHPQASLGMRNIQVGDKIVVSGPIASHGMAILSVRNSLGFEGAIESDTASVAGKVKLLLDSFGGSIHFMRDPTRGGVATVLNEVADNTGLTMQLTEDQLPVLGPVQDLCEILGLDPLYVANEGIFIAFIDPDVADACIDQLNSNNNKSSARIIGEVTNSAGGRVLMKSQLGGTRVVPMPVGEQLPRIC